jgi:hypothetical protein
MLTGAEIALIVRVAELARLLGLRPSEIDPAFGRNTESADGDLVNERYFLRFDNCSTSSGRSAKFDQLMKLLGCDGNFCLQCDDMEGLEDAVEAAFSRAPQPRFR